VSYTSVLQGDSDGPDLVNGLAPACRISTGPSCRQEVRRGKPASQARTSHCPGPLCNFRQVSRRFVSAIVAVPSGPARVSDARNVMVRPVIIGVSGAECWRFMFRVCLMTASTLLACSSSAIAEITIIRWRPEPYGVGASVSSGEFNSRSRAAARCGKRARRVPRTCPRTFNGQCNVQCPADYVIDGKTAPFQEEWTRRRQACRATRVRICSWYKSMTLISSLLLLVGSQCCRRSRSNSSRV